MSVSYSTLIATTMSLWPRSDISAVRTSRVGGGHIGGVAIIFVMMAVASCSSARKGPEPVVERFVQSINDKDVKVMLTCIDPRQERLFRASFRLVEKFTGGRLPVEDLLELVPGLYQIFRSDLASDFSIQNSQVYRAKMNGADAEVPVLLTTSFRANGIQKDEKLRLHVVLRQFEEGWRIVGILDGSQ